MEQLYEYLIGGKKLGSHQKIRCFNELQTNDPIYYYRFDEDLNLKFKETRLVIHKYDRFYVINNENKKCDITYTITSKNNGKKDFVCWYYKSTGGNEPGFSCYSLQELSTKEIIEKIKTWRINNR